VNRSARHQRWAQLRRRLSQPPRPRGQQLLERTVSPLELFYDLVVVVLVGQAAQHMAEHLNWHGAVYFAAVFTLTWIAWLNGTLHHDLHGPDDARSRPDQARARLLRSRTALAERDEQ
jgi:low temperature requirement protein LtrA